MTRRSPGFLRDAVPALSLANLCFIKVWFELLSHDFNAYYITETPPTAANLYGAVLNVIVTGGVILGLMRICRRFAGDSLDAPGKICFLLAVLVFLNGLRMQFWHLFLDVLGKTGAMVLLGGLTLGAAALLAGYRSTYRPARTFVLLVSPFVLLTFSQAVVIAQDHAISRGLRGKSPGAAASSCLSSQRVVILIYDEMDYRITFVDRPARAFLPELDRLRRESSFFTRAYPPAGGTLLSIPALITGKIVAGASTSRIDDLFLTFKDGTTSPWSSMKSIFSEAKAAGVNSAVVGCYHPYCRVVGDALSYCAAYPPTNAGLLESMLRQWRRLTPFYLRQQHMERYRFVQYEAEKVVADPRFGLVFVHLPVPHGPSIYDGMHDRFTLFGDTVSDNIDNLRLADRSFGDLRKAMEDSGVWPYTTVILTADHWWRTSRSYDGQEDHRVPFMVRTAGLKGREDVDEPFCTVSLPAVVRCVLAQKGHSEACDVLSVIRGNNGHLPSGLTKRAGIW